MSLATEPAHRTVPNLASLEGPILRPFEGVALRPLRVDEIGDGYLRGLNDPQVIRFLISAGIGGFTREMLVERVASDWAASDAVLFGIMYKGIHRGNVRLYGVTPQHANIGVAIFDQTVWGRGFGSIAVAAVAHYAVEELGVRQVVAATDHRNYASQKSFQRAGFRKIEDNPRAEGSVWCFP